MNNIIKATSFAMLTGLVGTTALAALSNAGLESQGSVQVTMDVSYHVEIVGLEDMNLGILAVDDNTIGSLTSTFCIGSNAVPGVNAQDPMVLSLESIGGTAANNGTLSMTNVDNVDPVYEPYHVTITDPINGKFTYESNEFNTPSSLYAIHSTSQCQDALNEVWLMEITTVNGAGTMTPGHYSDTLVLVVTRQI
jgi:hypothetical protein